MSIFISPHFLDTKLDSPTIEDVIDIYEDRIKYGLLNPARALLDIQYGQAASFCLLLTYFEGAWSYEVAQSSKNRSKEFFKLGFVDVFKSSGVSIALIERSALLLYEDARCGFFHDGSFRQRILLATMNKDLVITLPKTNGVLDQSGEIQSILIDPNRCLTATEKHFRTKILSLRDKQNQIQRYAFFNYFKSQCDWESPGPIVGIQNPNIFY